MTPIMDDILLHFKKKGFPEIKIYNDFFEVKSKDYNKFRKFNFNNIKEIKYYDPNNNWYTELLIAFSGIMTKWAAHKKYRYLRIYKQNNGYWNYILPESFDLELIDFLKCIEVKIGKKILNISE